MLNYAHTEGAHGVPPRIVSAHEQDVDMTGEKDSDFNPYDLPGGEHARRLDNLGPEGLHGISRYPEYPDDTDWSDAMLDPHSEAVGRFIGVCSQLEITLFRASSQLDPVVTFTHAELNLKPQGCIKKLKAIAEDLPPQSRTKLLALLERADHYVKLRNGVVHGVYRKNHLKGVHESRRYVRNRTTKEFELLREPYDRNTLLLAATRASNAAADILDGLAEWGRQLESARAIRAAHINNNMVFEGPAERPTLHALDGLLPATVCGLDATLMGRYRDLLFKNSNPENQCQECRTTLGL